MRWALVVLLCFCWPKTAVALAAAAVVVLLAFAVYYRSLPEAEVDEHTTWRSGRRRGEH